MHLDTKTPKIDFNKQAESTLEDPGLVDYDDGSVLVVDKVGETFEPDADNSNFQDPLYAPDLRLCVEGTQPDGKKCRVFIDGSSAIKVIYNDDGTVERKQGVTRDERAPILTEFTVGEPWEGSLAGTKGMLVTSIMSRYKVNLGHAKTNQESPFTKGEEYLKGWRESHAKVQKGQAMTALQATVESSVIPSREAHKDIFSVHSFEEAIATRRPELSDEFIAKARATRNRDYSISDDDFQYDTKKAARTAEYNQDNMDFWDDNGARKKFHDEMYAFEQEFGKVVPDPRAEGGERSNISQQTVATQFDSDAFVQKRVNGEQVSVDKRIYLNPRYQDTATVFTQILRLANSESLAFRAKIFNYDDMHGSLRNVKTKKGSAAYEAARIEQSRTDGIVLYPTDEAANELLSIVEEVSRSYPEAFASRETPAIPFQIADGIAVGSEPNTLGRNGEKTSLVEHRSLLIDETLMYMDALQARMYTPLATEEYNKKFRENLKQRFIDNGVNPNNWAFNR